jgi:hypothetical protein
MEKGLTKKTSEDLKPVIDMSEFVLKNTFKERTCGYLEDSLKSMKAYELGGNQ